MFETFHVCVCVTSIKLSVNSGAVSTLLTAKALTAGAVAVAAGAEDSAGAVAVAAGVEDSTGVIVGETMLIAKRFEPLLPTWLSLPVPVIVTL